LRESSNQERIGHSGNATHVTAAFTKSPIQNVKKETFGGVLGAFLIFSVHICTKQSKVNRFKFAFCNNIERKYFYSERPT
jgi:hypothetical protein